MNATQGVKVLREVESYHGYIGNEGVGGVISRAKMRENRNLGLIEWEAQSLEAPKGYPQAGPPDGKIASANTDLGKNLDEQTSDRWVKNLVKSKEILLAWHFTAPHKTAKWDYYITKEGWDQNSPLTRATFQLLATVDHNGTRADTNPTHTVSLPNGYSGYHVLLAVWEIADTSNAFYNVVDLQIEIDGSADFQSNPKPEQNQPTIDADPPTAPFSLHDMGTTSSTVDLMWWESTDNVGVVNYVIERAMGDGDFYALISIPFDPSKKLTDGENTYSYFDKGLTPGTTYRYRIFAFDAEGNRSVGSNVHTTKTNIAPGYHEVSGKYPKWDPKGTYNAGDRVLYLGYAYEAVRFIQGQGDPGWIDAESLWRRL